jgi:hypothetical protein
VIAGVNLSIAKVVAGIGDLIRMFVTSSHGGVATRTKCRTQRFGPAEAYGYPNQLLRNLAVVGIMKAPYHCLAAQFE